MLSVFTQMQAPSADDNLAWQVRMKELTGERVMTHYYEVKVCYSSKGLGQPYSYMIRQFCVKLRTYKHACDGVKNGRAGHRHCCMRWVGDRVDS